MAFTSVTGASSGSRYSCLGSEYGSSDEESPPAVGVRRSGSRGGELGVDSGG